MDDKIKINLNMAGGYFPATIQRKDEELVRAAAKQVDVSLNKFRALFQDESSDRVMAMVAYQFALENLQMKKRNDTEPYITKIEELTEVLENYFKEQ